MMTTEPFVAADEVDRLRRARARRAVVKTKFVTLKGRCSDSTILVLEGDDDKIVYGRWIARIRPTLQYEVFLCDGKKGISQLKSIIDDDLGNLRDKVYFFVDRDFDDLRDFTNDNNIYMTPTYSFENIIVSRKVVDSILRDEFPLHEHVDIRKSITDLFERQYRDFTFVTCKFNWILFQARKLRIPLSEKLPRRVSLLAQVELYSISLSQTKPEQVVLLTTPIDSAAGLALAGEFASLEPFQRYRGKNALMFLVRWLGLVAAEYSIRQTDMFTDCPEGGAVRAAELTLGAFASKSDIPSCFTDFIQSIAA